MGGSLLALACVCACASSADDTSAPDLKALKGTIIGAGAAHVWVAVVGQDLDEATWTLVKDGRIEIPMPAGEPVVVVAVARDRVPLAVAVPPVPPEALDRNIVLALSRGHWLEGIVRSEDGRIVSGADVRVAAADAVVLEGLALAGLPFSLRDVRMKIPLGDGRAVEVPPFARTKWTTSGDGTFRIGGLQPGRHFLEATATGFVPAFESHVGIREDDENDIDIELFEAFYVAGHVVETERADQFREPRSVHTGMCRRVLRKGIWAASATTGDVQLPGPETTARSD